MRISVLKILLFVIRRYIVIRLEYHVTRKRLLARDAAWTHNLLESIAGIRNDTEVCIGLCLLY